MSFVMLYELLRFRAGVVKTSRSAAACLPWYVSSKQYVTLGCAYALCRLACTKVQQWPQESDILEIFGNYERQTLVFVVYFCVYSH